MSAAGEVEYKIRYKPFSVCKRCRHRLTNDEEYDSMGVCPYCGYKGPQAFTICDTDVRADKITYRRERVPAGLLRRLLGSAPFVWTDWVELSREEVDPPQGNEGKHQYDIRAERVFPGIASNRPSNWILRKGSPDHD